MGLKERVQELEDRESIKELIAAQCYELDADNPDRYIRLWTKDAVKESDTGRRHVGHEEILNDYFREVHADKESIGSHMVHNPIIEVDGDSAAAKVYYDVPKILDGGVGQWRQGTYVMEFQRVEGEWKISRLMSTHKYYADEDTFVTGDPINHDVDLDDREEAIQDFYDSYGI